MTSQNSLLLCSLHLVSMSKQGLCCICKDVAPNHCLWYQCLTKISFLHFCVIFCRKTRRPRRREAANYKFPPSVSDYDSVEKRCLKTTIISHAPVAVATDLNCRENDYACMKYMSAHPDSMDEDNILNHSTETYCSDYIGKPIAAQPCVACANSLNRDTNLKLYESPESRIRILRPDVVSADKAHYFDLDPDSTSSLRDVTLPRPQPTKASATNYNTLKWTPNCQSHRISSFLISAHTKFWLCVSFIRLATTTDHHMFLMPS